MMLVILRGACLVATVLVSVRHLDALGGAIAMLGTIIFIFVPWREGVR